MLYWNILLGAIGEAVLKGWVLAEVQIFLLHAEVARIHFDFTVDSAAALVAEVGPSVGGSQTVSARCSC